MPATTDNERDRWLVVLRQQTEESQKSWKVAFTLSVFLGLFGADRLYLGHPVLGILKLFTCAFGGVWWIIDILLLLLGVMRDAQGKTVKRPF
jgi:TM2 domain-containing membrane protein YozV